MPTPADELKIIPQEYKHVEKTQPILQGEIKEQFQRLPSFPPLEFIEYFGLKNLDMFNNDISKEANFVYEQISEMTQNKTLGELFTELRYAQDKLTPTPLGMKPLSHLYHYLKLKFQSKEAEKKLRLYEM